MSWRRAVVRGSLSSLLIAAATLSATPAGSKSEIERQIRFGTEMAQQGNWREAIFRWKRALLLEPGNSRLHNNLAVAYETLGDYDKAEAEYRAALASSQVPGPIRENYDLFFKFYKRHREYASSPDAAPTVETPTRPPSPSAAPPDGAPSSDAPPPAKPPSPAAEGPSHLRNRRALDGRGEGLSRSGPL